MKPFVVILFIILLIGVGVGLVYLSRTQNKTQPAMVPEVSPTVIQGTAAPSNASQTTAAAQTQAPIPTVAQIKLSISSPASGTTVTSPAISVRGVTTPKAEVFVNDTQLSADAQGNFSTPITLDEGDNSIVITANDANGNYAEQELTVIYNSGQ